ncbi:MAG: protein TolQ [Burkholderiales bacterium]|nr:protein TolQ [Burkholderiales bacterium]
MNIHADLSIVTLVIQASLIVKIVLGILLLASFWSLLRIAMKYLQLRRARREVITFEDQFWRGGDINAIHQSLGNVRTGDGLENIFASGFREYQKHKKQASSREVTVESTRRAMNVAYRRELDSIESGLPGLATIGSVSPYIGLFGTVWGIMNAFRGLASVSQATLAQVAPGIAEALIATAIGLFAAIPAAIAYNRFVNDVDRLATSYETFIEEFANILLRQS